jgi:hypothetical protein
MKLIIVLALTVVATQAANPRFRAVSQATGDDVKVQWQAGKDKMEVKNKFPDLWQKMNVGTSNDGVVFTGKLNKIVDLLKSKTMPTACSTGHTQFSITVSKIKPTFAEAFLSNVPNLGPGGGTVTAVTAWFTQYFAEELIHAKVIKKDVVVKITDAKPPGSVLSGDKGTVYLPCPLSTKLVAAALSHIKEA